MTEMWNSVAEAWGRNADYVDVHMAACTEAMLEAMNLGPGDAVLELAAGPGGAGIAAAARVGKSGRVVLADVAPAMVQVAAQRSAGLAQIETLVCDQSAIDAPDASFDAVISRHGLMFAESPVDAVQEACRVLRDDGRFGTITWDTREANPWLGIVLDAVGEQFGVPFPPPHIAGPFSLDDAVLLAQTLSDGGLADVEVNRIATPMTANSIEAWWERVPQLAGPLAIALAGMDDDVREAIRERATARGSAASRATEYGIEMAGSVLVGTGRRGG